jgi:putative FmdB family regulatory protein
MPRYDYICLDCQKEETVSLTLKEHETSSIKCSACGSERMEQLIANVTAKTSRKS